MVTRNKKIGDLYLNGPTEEFTFGQIREGIKRASSPSEKESKVLTYAISREGVSDKDLDKLRKKIKKLGKVDHNQIVVPEKVVVTGSKIYFVFPLNKDKPFVEAYKERIIKLPKFYEKMINCLFYLKEKKKNLLPAVVQPETLRFDHKGEFEWHDLNCDFLLKKKFFTERIKERKKEAVLQVHAPEVINPSSANKLDPEKSLAYSLGILFDGIANERAEAAVPDILTKQCQKFIDKMGEKTIEDRPEIDEILDYKWKSAKKKNVSFGEGTKEGADEASGDKKKWKDQKEFKKGKFSSDEVEIIKHAICRYASQNGWGEEDLLRLIINFKDPQFRGTWTKVAEALPERRVASIHQLVRTRFHPGNYKGGWTEDEEKKLIKLVDEHGRKWQLISDELGRTPMNVRDKWKEMGEENHEKREKGGWKAEEIIKLFRIIERRTGLNLMDKDAEAWLEEERKRREEGDGEKIDRYENRGKNSPFKKILESQLCNYINYDEAKQLNYLSFEWKKISKEMETKTRDDCRNLWYHQVFNTIATYNDFAEDEDEILIQEILEQDTVNESEINFNDINNGRSPQDNRIRWKQLARAASSRASRSTSEMLKAVRKYVRQLRENRQSEYSYSKLSQRVKEKDELIELFKSQYQK